MKIRVFVAEIFAKQYWRLFNPKFSMYFAYFHNLSIKVPPNFEKYVKHVEACGNYISKCPDISENMAPILLNTVLLNKSYLKIFCIIHCESPCNQENWVYLASFNTFPAKLRCCRKFCRSSPYLQNLHCSLSPLGTPGTCPALSYGGREGQIKLYYPMSRLVCTRH